MRKDKKSGNSAPLSKNALSAFQISCKLLSFTLKDSWRKKKRFHFFFWLYLTINAADFRLIPLDRNNTYKWNKTKFTKNKYQVASYLTGAFLNIFGKCCPSIFLHLWGGSFPSASPLTDLLDHWKIEMTTERSTIFI